ncbi:unnamed protein product [Brassica oleracea var. botrytis]
MERKVYLIWVIIVLGQIHVYKSCIEEERKALLNLKTYLASEGSRQHHHFPTFDYILHTWTNDTTSDCCKWEGVNCTLTSAQVNGLAFLEYMYLPDKALLNLSLLHPFEELRSLNLSGAEYQFGGLFDDVEGYKSLRKLRNLEVLDFSLDAFDNSIFPFPKAATSLTTLLFRRNSMDGPFPVKRYVFPFYLRNLELLDLSSNSFSGSIPGRELSALSKLKAVDLSGNHFSGSLKGESAQIL